MKNLNNTNENGQSSRGEQALDIKESFENTEFKSEKISEKPAKETGTDSMYSAENSELDAMLDDATTTQKQHKANEREQQATPKSKYMPVEQAMDISLKGLVGLTKMASEYSGREIEINQNSAMLFATLTAPMIQKYGAKINFDPNKVDLESWMPEMMALGGVAVVGYPMFKQMQAPLPKTVKNDESESDSGNKS